MESIIYHWVMLIAATEEGIEGLGLLILYLTEYFYVDNGIVTSNQLERLQQVFNILTGLFNRVVLRTNMWNSVIRACLPCHAPGRMPVDA